MEKIRDDVVKNKIIAILTDILNEEKTEEDAFLLNSDELEKSEDLKSIGLNSIDFVHMVVLLEDEFGIEIPDECLRQDLMNSVGQILETVMSAFSFNEDDMEQGSKPECEEV